MRVIATFKKMFREEFEDPNESFLCFLLSLIPKKTLEEIIKNGSQVFYNNIKNSCSKFKKLNVKKSLVFLTKCGYIGKERIIVEKFDIGNIRSRWFRKRNFGISKNNQ